MSTKTSTIPRPLRTLTCLGFALAATGVVACDGRRAGANGESVAGEPASGPSIHEIDLRGGASEAGASSLFGPVPGRSFTDLEESLRALPSKNPGIFLQLGTSNVGLAAASEIGGELARLRAGGTPIVCHADGLSNTTALLVAKGCSEVWLSPSGGVDTVGIAAQLVFGKSLFAKVGVSVDFLQVGKYKGAQEPFTRDEPSPEARESLEGTLKDLRAAWIQAVNEGRGRDLGAALEDGPYTAQAAVSAGLVDALGYVDEARARAKKLGGAVRTVSLFGGAPTGGGGAGEILRSLAGADPTATPHVAVVRAVGAISMSGGGGFLPGSEGITASGLGSTIARVARDDSVLAVVLRIDSPGGSALASDLLWHQLMNLRSKKPLIVSVGGMAASGGYYLACAGDQIFADDASIVGSIGVVGGKFSFKDPLASIGVHAVTVAASPDPTRAARAAYMSPFDAWDDATRSKVLASMQGLYDLFLDRIAEGRNMPRDEVAGFAEGRIFGGATALEKRMVDHRGGLSDAISFALVKSGLGQEGAVRVVNEKGGLGALLGLGGADARADLDAEARRAADALNPLRGLVAAFPPEAIEWLGASWALTQGEETLAVAPFAMILR